MVKADALHRPFLWVIVNGDALSVMVKNNNRILGKGNRVMERTLIMLCLLSLSTVAGAEIFKWVDEQGRIHYGDKPVENSESITVDTDKKGNMNTGPSREEKRKRLLDAMQEDNERNQKEEKKNKEKKQKQKRKCLWAKDRLQRLERASYMYDLDSKGNKVIASNEQRSTKTEQLRKSIKKYCN